MSQNNDILRHLKTGNSITPIDALNLFGCFRLAARIYELRTQGHLIDTVDVRSGNKIFAAYKLNDRYYTKAVASV